MIYYFCPDMTMASGGLRRIYRHIAILNQAGLAATVLHTEPNFLVPDQPKVPVANLREARFETNDVVVVPEGYPRIMKALADTPARRMVLALSWSYIYLALPRGEDWRHYGIERVMVVCPVIGEMVSWSMKLPVHLLMSGIDRKRYFFDQGTKQARVVYIKRKAEGQIGPLQALLTSRYRALTKKIEWRPLDALSQDEYAAEIRNAALFLQLSSAEGLVNSCLEAMTAGTLVAGYDGVGGRGMLVGDGPQQNAVLAPCGDYVTLAMKLEPLLKDLQRDRFSNWAFMQKNAFQLAAPYTQDAEKDSVIAYWQEHA